MRLDELKFRLGIPSEDQSQDEELKISLEDGIEFAKTWCNNPFLNDMGELDLPSPVKRGIAMMIDIDQTIPNGVQSESIAGMSRTFTSGFTAGNERYAPVFKLWKPYKKGKFV